MMEINFEKNQDGDVHQETLAQIKNLMGDKFTALIESYLEDSARYLAQAEEALAEGNAQLLANAVHPLKSSSATLGVMTVSKLASGLEHKADALHQQKEGDLSALLPLLEDLRRSFVESERILKKEMTVA